MHEKSKPHSDVTVASEQSGGSGSGVGTFNDLGVGFVEGAVARPYNATLGLVLPKIDLSQSFNEHTVAAKVGDFCGMALDMAILSKVSGWGVGKALRWGARKEYIGASLARSPMLASSLSLGTTGALYEGVLTPGSATTRLQNATVGFATFSTLGASTAWLGRFSSLGKAGSRTLLQEAAVGGLSGIPAGITHVEATSLVNGRGVNYDPYALSTSALYFAGFGAAMGGASKALTDAVARSRYLLGKNSTVSREQVSVSASEETGVSGSKAEGARGVAKTEEALVVAKAEAVPVVAKAGEPPVVAKAGEAPVTRSFNIPESGHVDLGRLMRETSAADQIRLVQEVIASRPHVPVGSWMRLVAREDMVQFLRAMHQMYPETGLTNARYLVETGNLRPATPESPPIDFKAWREALDLVRSEKPMPPQPVSEKDMLKQQLSEPASKPFTYDDVTMSVKNPDLLRQAIANNADGALGSRVLEFANKWATIMEGKMARGERLTREMASKADSEVGMDLRNYEYDIARNVLIDTWKHGAELERALPSMAFTEAELAGVTTGTGARTKPGAELTPPKLTAGQQAELENFGAVLLSLSSSRAEAISRVRAIESGQIDPLVRRALLSELQEGQVFLRRMGVDSAESTQSIVRAMKNVPTEEIPRFVHHADQFKHDPFPNSVMSQMDQAVARGNIPPGTQQAWIDAISAKMRRVFPGIPESQWAISSLNR